MSEKASSSSDSKDAAPTNPRGIPYAPFVDKVEEYVSSRAEVDGTMRSFQEMISYGTDPRPLSLVFMQARTASGERSKLNVLPVPNRKYQFMEVNTQRRAAGLKEKMPDIQKTLDMVRFLKTRKPGSEDIETTFELNDTLYAKALVPPTDEVYLWLGASVMLAYPIDEAETLLESKLGAAKQNLANCEEDLDFLREQITTLEVATARVYNWDVTQKRREKEEGRGEEEDESEGRREDGKALKG